MASASEIETPFEATAFLTDTAWSYTWLLVLLVFVFPQARQSVVLFLTSVLQVLKLPFDLILQKYRK